MKRCIGQGLGVPATKNKVKLFYNRITHTHMDPILTKES